MVTRLNDGLPQHRSAEAASPTNQLTISRCRNGFMVQSAQAADCRCVVNTVDQLLEVIRLEFEVVTPNEAV